jgi:hypothetical protein
MFIHPTQFVGLLDLVAVRTECISMTHFAVLLFLRELFIMNIQPFWGVWCRHSVTVVTKIFLVASLTRCLVTGCFLLVTSYPFSAEN